MEWEVRIKWGAELYFYPASAERVRNVKKIVDLSKLCVIKTVKPSTSPYRGSSFGGKVG